MNAKRYALLLLMTTVIIFTSCQSGETEGASELPTTDYQPNAQEVAFEEMIASIDANDSLRIGNSLFYSKPTGESIEVRLFVNAKNETVKMVERYTEESTQSVFRNVFYLKEGKKFATRELFGSTVNGKELFNERVSYYDEKEQPVLSKFKSANYEEELDYESFVTMDPYDCKMERALNVINQEGEFATTFQGFVKEDAFLYLIVGENEKDGYSSSLVVQYVDYTIKKLQEDELKMIGTPLIVDFETVTEGGEGYEYQILHKVSLR